MIIGVMLLLGATHARHALPSVKSWKDDSIVFQEDKAWDGNSYSFGFKTLFGSSRKEKAELKKDELGFPYMDVEGEYIYPKPDGSVRKVSYRANNRGYQESEFDNRIVNRQSDIINSDHKSDIKNTVSKVENDTNIKRNVLIGSDNDVADIDLKSEIQSIGSKVERINNINPINSDSDEIQLKVTTEPDQQLKIGITPIIDHDKIYFPKENEESDRWTTESTAVLTTSLMPLPAMNVTNGTSVDYYYDELGNRIGGIPPAVLGSLLG